MEQRTKNKTTKATSSRPSSRKAAATATATTGSLFNKNPKVSPYLFIFIALWVFCALVYDDVFYITEQNSIFAFDNTIMKNVLQKEGGPLIVVSRCFLLSFHYPVLGGALFAFLLTCSTWLTTYVFGLSGKWNVLPYLPAFGILIYLVNKGVNIYYQREPSLVFILPLCYFLLSFICALIKRFWSKKPFSPFFKTSQIQAHDLWIQIAAIVLLWGATTCYANFTQQNAILTSKMQRQLQQYDIESMIETAKTARQPSRSVAAYYAIALSQANCITEKLFEIPYQYPDEHIYNREGKKDVGTETYMADCNFYAGLVNSAYHASMERMVVDGPSIYRLKRMVLCAILNDEKALARKYIYILKQVPFEQKFIETYEPMITDRQRIAANQELKQVTDLIPMNDEFEQKYKEPIFLGYNISLTTGRSIQALKNSLAACLYAKLLPNVIERTQPLVGGSLPPLVEEAVMVYGINEPSILEQFQIGPMAKERLQQFMMEAQKNKDIKDNKKKIFRNIQENGFAGYYPLYYYYGNIPDPIETKQQKAEKEGGVN
ncbi:MAG: DUF6057 family protein [Bacteroidaceae bacterium]